MAESHGLFFQGFKLDSEVYAPGDYISVETTIVNGAGYPATDLVLQLKILRNSDSAVVFSSAEPLELAPGEVRFLNKSARIPSALFGGDYTVVVGAISAAGIPLASMFREIEIDVASVKGKGIIFSEGGLYLRYSETQEIAPGITQTLTHRLYGTVGETIPRQSTLFAEFGLQNPTQSSLELTARLRMVSSYSPLDTSSSVLDLSQNLGNLASGESGRYSIAFKPPRPGTYSVIVGIYSGEDFLGEKEVRAVISGETGSIMEVENFKGRYEPGEQGLVRVHVVGPADKSNVSGAYLELSVYSAEKEVANLVKESMTLTAKTQAFDFYVKPPEGLEEYVLSVELGKGGEVFDSVNQSYKELSSELIMSDDGRILSRQAEACFDNGVCTPEEEIMGDCLDCAAIEKTIERVEYETYQIYKLIAVIMLIVAFVLFVYLKAKK
ncbi:MAG: hypothetical protein JW727_04270 [Candidatus Aenigmarchaeota archaeon]|nr:hypothetical protein [Candidatus Aenigmarchaeota archaeon]